MRVEKGNFTGKKGARLRRNLHPHYSPVGDFINESGPSSVYSLIHSFTCVDPFYLRSLPSSEQCSRSLLSSAPRIRKWLPRLILTDPRRLLNLQGNSLNQVPSYRFWLWMLRWYPVSESFVWFPYFLVHCRPNGLAASLDTLQLNA